MESKTKQYPRKKRNRWMPGWGWGLTIINRHKFPGRSSVNVRDCMLLTVNSIVVYRFKCCSESIS